VFAGALVDTADVCTGGDVVDTAGVDPEGELGEGLKLSKVEPPVPAGSVSCVAAGRGALETVVDFRPRL